MKKVEEAEQLKKEQAELAEQAAGETKEDETVTIQVPTTSAAAPGLQSGIQAKSGEQLEEEEDDEGGC